MGVEQDQLSDPLMMEVPGDCEPAVYRFVECERARASNVHMLDRITDGFDREEGDRQMIGKGTRHALDDAGGNDRVRLEREMGTVLLVRA